MSYVEASDVMWDSLFGAVESIPSGLSILFTYPSPFYSMIPLFVLAFSLLFVEGLTMFLDFLARKLKLFKDF